MTFFARPPNLPSDPPARAALASVFAASLPEAPPPRPKMVRTLPPLGSKKRAALNVRPLTRPWCCFFRGGWGFPMRAPRSKFPSPRVRCPPAVPLRPGRGS